MSSVTLTERQRALLWQIASNQGWTDIARALATECLWARHMSDIRCLCHERRI